MSAALGWERRGITATGRGVLREAAQEWARLTAVPGDRLSAGWRAFPLTLGSAGLVLGMWLAQATDLGTTIVRWVGGVYADLPLPLALVRLPLSLFAPAPHLPVWGSLLQVLVVFGLAEAWFGARRTLVLAISATAIATMSGRVMYGLGPDNWLGVSSAVGHVRDTGPSAAVVALIVYVCLQRKAMWVLATVIATMVGEVVVLPNLAGREHIVAVTVGLIAASPVPALMYAPVRWDRILPRLAGLAPAATTWSATPSRPVILTAPTVPVAPTWSAAPAAAPDQPADRQQREYAR